MSRTTRRPAGLAGMLVLVALVELMVQRNDLAFAHNIGLAWRWSGRAASTRARDAEVLCLGDSLVKLGVVPRLVKSRGGGRALNLAVPGGQASSSYFLLKRALDAGARPRAVVVDFHSNLLAAAPRSSLRDWAYMIRPGELADLAWTAHDPKLLAATTAALLLPTVRYRDEIRLRVREALRGDAGEPHELALLAYRRNWRVNQGTNLAPALDGLCPDDLPPGPENGRWRAYPPNVAYMNRILKLAKLHNISVFWLIPPATPAWQERRDRLGADAAFTAFVRRVAGREPSVTVIDARRAGYDLPAFRDSTHLNRRGAAALSRELGAILAAPPSERWVALPAYREPPPEPGLEDTDQSKLAVGLDDARSRR